MSQKNSGIGYLALRSSSGSNWQRLKTCVPGAVVSGLFAIGILVAGIAWLSFSRHYFGYGTETDFLGSLIYDAIAFSHGQPLKVAYQPPLYPISVALIHMLNGDWFMAGRVLSLVSAAIALVTSFFFYRSSVSNVAAWGAITGLAMSPLFIAYSAYVTTDVFFLALYSTVLLLACLGEQRASTVLWCATGIVLALALLARANALTLIMVAVIPLLARNQTWRGRILCFGALMAGTFIPLASWGIYASISNSNLWPSEGATINLALTYFRPYKGADWGSSIDFAKSTFSNVWDVFTYDPARMLKIYVKNLYHVFRQTLWPDLLFSFPGNCFILPAVAYLFLIKQPRWMYYVFALTLAQLLLVNFKTYDARYCLFLIPFLGALTAEFIVAIYRSRREYPASRALITTTVLSVLLIMGLVQSGANANASVHQDELELTETIPAARKVMSSDSVVVARKPVLAYYSGATFVPIPQEKSVKDLLAYVSSLPAAKTAHGKSLFIYYGKKERSLRPEYRKLLDVSKATRAFSRLQLVARGSQDGGRNPWVLYRYDENVRAR